MWEEEPDSAGVLVPTAVLFLTNRECPFRCVMCDLWVNTLDRTVAPGSIPTQIRTALAQMGPAPAAAGTAEGRRHTKLYNAGSFFDPRAIPPDDDEEIARLVAAFDRVVVEAHPAFLTGIHGDRCVRFRDRLDGRLEVAIGLETAHPEVLARLNKRMTLATFARGAGFLAEQRIDLRVFVLLNPPFLRADEGVEWACRSLEFAAASGATACSVIPTRGGNGALEALGADFVTSRLPALEAVVEYGLSLRRMRVFADLWDVERFFDCACSPARAARLREMNRRQAPAPAIPCECDARV